MTPIAGTAVTSDRSLCAFAAFPVVRSTVGSGDMRVEIGFMPTRITSGSPVVTPPSSPPALLLRLRYPPRSAGSGALVPGTASASIGSCTSEPGRRAASNPIPISTALTAGMDINAPARRPSSFRSQCTWLPRPTGSPRTTTCASPPRVSPSFFA